MTRVWQLQEAKNKFSEVVDEAIKHGPQVITKRGIETVIVLSYAEYRKIIQNQQRSKLLWMTNPCMPVATWMHVSPPGSSALPTNGSMATHVCAGVEED